MIKEKEILSIVYEKDLKEFFKKLNLLTELEQGNLVCSFCGKPITLKNFHSLSTDKGRINLTCDEQYCIDTLLVKQPYNSSSLEE